ncbi:MAG TPA: hypothetical protein VFT01_03105 [Homoserinimonas sp.]|nr:hypothetical protein [Homoserinimonas sp.]
MRAETTRIDHRRRATIATIIAGCTIALAAACSFGQEPATRPAGSGSVLPQADEPVDLNPADFSTEIDNTYWPMATGTRWIYQETDVDGGMLRVVVTVTSQTKEIANGVTARVVRDTVSMAGEILEDTFDWYAQDSRGTIWYLGEDTAEFEDGELTSREGSFEAGVDGALPGVIMPGEPVVGVAYRQEYYEGEAEDNGQVLSLDEMADTPAGHFDNVLLTKDTITIEPDVLEYKLYAPGVGPVLVFGVSGGAGREELLEFTEVSSEIARAAGTTPLGQPYE